MDATGRHSQQPCLSCAYWMSNHELSNAVIYEMEDEIRSLREQLEKKTKLVDSLVDLFAAQVNISSDMLRRQVDPPLTKPTTENFQQ